MCTFSQFTTGKSLSNYNATTPQELSLYLLEQQSSPCSMTRRLSSSRVHPEEWLSRATSGWILLKADPKTQIYEMQAFTWEVILGVWQQEE